MLLALLGAVLAALAADVPIATPVPAASVPVLAMPRDWVAATTLSGSLVGQWTRPPRKGEMFPVRVMYISIPDRSFDAEIELQRRLASCGDGGQGTALMVMMHLCGFELDADETHAGNRAHRFVRRANFGPPQLIGHTEVVIPWGPGILEVVYDRPATELLVNVGREADVDPVLDAIRTWEETPAAPAP